MWNHKPGARIFDRSTSFASVTLDPDLIDLGSPYRCKPIPESASPARTAKKLLRKKKNESWAMRRRRS